MSAIEIKTRLASMATRGALVGSRDVWVRPSQIKVGDSGGGEMRDLYVIANTDAVDMAGEVVVPAGADSLPFRINGKIFVDHRYDTGSVVAGLRDIVAFPNPNNIREWRVRMRVRRGQLGDDILAMAREIGIGSSIGFEATAYGPPTDEERAKYSGPKPFTGAIIRSWRWFELSLTAMPCNIACQAIEVPGRVDDSKAADVERLVSKGTIKVETAVALGVPLVGKRKVYVGQGSRPTVVAWGLSGRTML